MYSTSNWKYTNLVKKQILFLLRYVWSLLNHFQLRRRRRFATYLVLLGATQDKINFLSYWLRIEVRLSPMCHCRRCQNTIYSHLSALSLPHPQSLLIRASPPVDDVSKIPADERCAGQRNLSVPTSQMWLCETARRLHRLANLFCEGWANLVIVYLFVSWRLMGKGI